MNLMPFLEKLADLAADYKADLFLAEGVGQMTREQCIALQKGEVTAALQKACTTLNSRIAKGHLALMTALHQVDEKERGLLQTELDNACQNLRHVDANEKRLLDESLQDICGVSVKTMLWIYKVGYQSFQEKKFETAIALFLILVLLNAHVSDYWTALACAERAVHDELGALLAFSMASILDQDNTMSRIQSADIYLVLHRKEDASAELDALEEIIERKHLDDLRPQLALLRAQIG